jgi:hypothetical protein
LSLALAFAVRHRSSACSFSSSTAIQGKRQKKTKISGLGHTLTQKPQAWLGAHEHGQDPGENWRRIEHFIGENEHLNLIRGRRPVYCQNLFKGGRPGLGTER